MANAYIVAHEMCAAAGVTWRQVYSHRRDQKTVKVRHAIWVALADMGLSTTQIGRMFNRDHSGVVYALCKLRGEQWALDKPQQMKTRYRNQRKIALEFAFDTLTNLQAAGVRSPGIDA